MTIGPRAVVVDASTRALGTVLALCIGSYVLVRAWSLSTENALGPDGGYFIMRAWQVRAGAVPYRDFYWWHTPAFPYLHNAVASAFGETREVLNCLVWTQYLGTLALLFAACLFLFQAPVWVLAVSAAFFLVPLEPFEGFYYVLEPFVSFFGWLGFVLALWSTRNEDSPVLSFWLALAAGLATGFAFWIKQVGVVFVLLAAAVATLHQGSPRLRPALLIIAMAAAVPIAFFGLHPDALAPAYRMLFYDFARYAASADQHAVQFDLSTTIRGVLWLPIMILVGLLHALFRMRSPSNDDRGNGRIWGACMVVGLALFAPSLAKPYRHYLLSPLPFAILALAGLLSSIGRDKRPGSVLSLLLVCVVAWPAKHDLWRVLDPRRAPSSTLAAERAIAAFIAQHARDAEKVYIAPNTPQYYVYLGRPGIDGDYLYLPDEDRVRASLGTGVPAFLVDRGGADIDWYEAEFRSAGYDLVERQGPVSAWRRARPGRSDPE